MTLLYNQAIIVKLKAKVVKQKIYILSFEKL